MQSSVSSGKGKCTPKAIGELPYTDRSSSPGPWLACTPANGYPKSSQFDWSKRHCPDGAKWSCSDWSVKKLMEYSCTALIGWRKSQSYGLKQDSKNSLIRIGSDGRNTVQVGSSMQASHWSTVCMRDPFVEMAAWLFVVFCFFIWAQLATRSPS